MESSTGGGEGTQKNVFLVESFEWVLSVHLTNGGKFYGPRARDPTYRMKIRIFMKKKTLLQKANTIFLLVHGNYPMRRVSVKKILGR